ncbi:hypothetical protein D0839_14525 [Bordetella avium]|nr:hypothetical protein C0J07_10810 [Bordetella avium]RIQ11926.1 hypothetical protein D0432_14740 [Bordetella avium]RIQ17797.1 hypothetical protein D0850_09950 [Bordetella avium]RIQ32455.1 hypothetical protein D0849_12995 [Bordetella avium]RIQ37025.1 hypothetical protein D0848_12425 [Bordetella avium]
MRQRKASSSWMQGTPAGLPCGMPGIGLEIEGAMQQAAQAVRHCMVKPSRAASKPAAQRIP